MASRLYSKTREKFLTAQLSWLVGAYKAVLLPEAYVPDFDDLVLSDILVGSRIATSAEIANKTATNGLAGCDPISFGIIADSRRGASIVIFKDTGDESTSDLIAFIDSEDIFGAPINLVGLDYFFIPDSATGALFRL